MTYRDLLVSGINSRITRGENVSLAENGYDDDAVLFHNSNDEVLCFGSKEYIIELFFQLNK